MDELRFSRTDKTLYWFFGLPSWITIAILALGYGTESKLLYATIPLVGWYLYTLMWWKLYQRHMLRQVWRKASVTFYFLLTMYQLLIVGCIYLLIAYN